MNNPKKRVGFHDVNEEIEVPVDIENVASRQSGYRTEGVTSAAADRLAE
jgi:hypothetical protein